MRRVIGMATIVACLMLATPTWAAGGDGPPPPTPGGGVVGQIVYGEVIVGVGPYRGQRRPCQWARMPEPQPASYPLTTVAFDGKEMWYLFTQTCGATVRGVWIAPKPAVRLARAPLVPAFMPKWVPSPSPQSAPPNNTTFVKLGTWFWTDTVWEDVVAHAHTLDADGNTVWAETTAHPVGLRFDPGDGNPAKTCTGPGEVYQPDFGDELETPCMYTYLHSSVMAPDGEAYQAKLSIEWEITFRSSDGPAESLGSMLTTVDFPFAVREIHALVVPNP